MDMEANSSPSSFFKIILPQSLQKGSLRIPKSFVDRHGNCFSKFACLEVPTGATWKVELRKSEGRVWLQNGWREFAEFYSIKEGYFLVFKHEGGSFFHVLIFNPTDMEITYPDGSAFAAPRPESKPLEIKDEDTDVSSDYEHTWPRKRQVKISGSEKISVPASIKQRIKQTRQVYRRSLLKKAGISVPASIKKQLRQTHQVHRRRLIEKAGIFKSDKPHFILYITPTFITLKGIVRIPAAHFKGYLRKDYENHGRNGMVLRGSKGRSWGVQFNVNGRNPNNATFSYGWKQFVVENKLEAGDVCLFEMMKGNAREYKVTTYHLRT